MKFYNCVISTAVCAALSLPAFAANVDIYGKANLTVQSSDDGEGSYSEVNSNASRIGFKGEQDLGNGLEVVFKAEFEVDLDGDGTKGTGDKEKEVDTFESRNQYLGLRGAFGEVLVGKNDTMLKQSQGKVDLFSDLNGDIKVLWKGENRMSDTISYKSPKFNHFQVGLTYIAEDEKDGDDATSIAVFYGDKSLKKTNIFASVAFDSEVKGYDTTRATVQGKIAGVTLGAIYHTQENISDGQELDGFLVSAKYSLDKLTFKGQVQTAEVDGGDDRSSYTVGADYSLAKSTKIFTYYSSFDLDSKEDQDYLALGLEYKF